MVPRFAIPLALAALGAASASAAQAPDATPAGTYLVYGEPGGTAFVIVEPGRASADRWPLRFFYFQDGTLAGTAAMAGEADCAAGEVRGRLTAAAGPNGEALPIAVDGAPAIFTFGRVESAGDQAIVTFICHDAAGRQALAGAPIDGEPGRVAQSYAALRAAGLDDPPARALARATRAEAEAMIDQTVPEELRDRTRAILAQPD